MFDFDLPEHLPNSPLCPANKKHRNEGMGLCVYHGRGKVGVSPQKEPNIVASLESLGAQRGIDQW